MSQTVTFQMKTQHNKHAHYGTGAFRMKTTNTQGDKWIGQQCVAAFMAEKAGTAHLDHFT